MVMPALESVRLGKTRNEAAACLTATVLIAPADTYFLKLSVAVGDVVRLLDDGGKEIFLGSVHELDRTPETVTLTAYDRGVYLARNELYGVYAGTGRRIAGKIAGELGVPLGAVEDDGLYRTIVTGPGESAFSILRRAVGEGREIAVRDGRVLAAAQNTGDITACGRFQRVMGKSGDPQAQAKTALRRRSLSARVTVLGDLSLRCGGRVEVHRPQWGLEGVYDITAHEHRWEKGVFTTSLSLEGVEA